MERKIILASGSPRRKELLEGIGLSFEIDSPPSSVEVQPDGHAPEELAKLNAQRKAEAIVSRHPSAIILGVDTVGECEGKVLEKPKDREDARRMLQLLQANEHDVISAIHIIDTETGKNITVSERTTIRFYPLSEADIEHYLDTGEYADKAAAYAVQGIAALFVQSIQGDFFNVVGLPLHLLHQSLKEFDIDLLQVVE